MSYYLLLETWESPTRTKHLIHTHTHTLNPLLLSLSTERHIQILLMNNSLRNQRKCEKKPPDIPMLQRVLKKACNLNELFPDPNPILPPSFMEISPA